MLSLKTKSWKTMKAKNCTDLEDKVDVTTKCNLYHGLDSWAEKGH